MPSPLSEKNFIHEGFSKKPGLAFLWLGAIILITFFFWTAQAGYHYFLRSDLQKQSFFHVTNRNFSLFLWQNPEFMRVNTRIKTDSYLPAFTGLKGITVNPEQADEYVMVPPEVLFRYHTWNRLVGQDFTPHPIYAEEFLQFLRAVPEWQPGYWINAPKEYDEIVSQLLRVAYYQEVVDVPEVVQRAFQGWKNYFKEGEAVNLIQPTYKELNKFLFRFPHYARNYWQNILEATTPRYLEMSEQNASEEIVPSEELAPFLKVALYNFRGEGTQRKN